MTTNDAWLKQFVREGYDHLVKMSVIRMGWNPFWYLTEKYGRESKWKTICDGCQPADTVILATKLSDAGVGDYWDDVDAVVRNQMVEQHTTDLEKIREHYGIKRDSEAEQVLKRFLGGTSSAAPHGLRPLMLGCCTPNNALGMYYAWHGITRYESGVATVNLLLNRSSDWMDIDSYLPYEGKAILHNKKAHTALVRLPVWVDRKTLRCSINGKTVNSQLTGNRLVFVNLKNGDDIRIEFDVPVITDKYTIFDTEYTVTFRGGTVLAIQPQTDQPRDDWRRQGWKWKLLPTYSRERMRMDRAPMKEADCFIADSLVSPP